MTSSIRIGKTSSDQWFCCSPDGKIVDGPFATSDEAVECRTEIETSPPRHLAKLTIERGLNVNLPSLSGVATSFVGPTGPDAYWVCMDGAPNSSYESLEEAQAAQKVIEAGTAPLWSFWRTSTGVGDAIAFAAAAAILAERNGRVLLPIREEYRATVKSIFIDHPTVEFIEAGAFCKNPEPDNLLISHDALWHRDTWCGDQYERVYRRFGIPYEKRWSASPVPSACHKVAQVAVPSGEYAFVHQDVSRRFLIDCTKLSDLPVFLPKFDPAVSILAYKDVLESAARIDVIDSAFLWLAEALNLNPRGKLFLHRYPRPYLPMCNNYRFRHAWIDVWTEEP
jgi:hypothetical protein